jgi:hypothetical protein
VYTTVVSQHATKVQWAAGPSEQMAHGAEGSSIIIHNLLITTSMIVMPKIIIFIKITYAKNASPRAEVNSQFFNQLIEAYIRGEILFLLKI